MALWTFQNDWLSGHPFKHHAIFMQTFEMIQKNEMNEKSFSSASE